VARIEVSTPIAAAPWHCFDLARDIDFHTRSMAHTGERVVAGVTSGLIEAGERVTWEGRHFGVRQRFTVEITRFEPPRMFRDEMVRGAFRSFAHDHIFEPVSDGSTVMRDILEFRSPLGPLGSVVDALFMRRYLRRLIQDRARAIRAEAERVM
jgi:ligand-binding SRPBCC domain-containing protein